MNDCNKSKISLGPEGREVSVNKLPGSSRGGVKRSASKVLPKKRSK